MFTTSRNSGKNTKKRLAPFRGSQMGTITASKLVVNTLFSGPFAVEVHGVLFKQGPVK